MKIPKRRTIAIITCVVTLAFGLLAFVDSQHRYDVTTKGFTVSSGGNDLAATIALPTSGEPVGVVIFIHGDGPTDAANGDVGYRPIWEALADVGYASISWDKPGVGGSTGDWLDQSRFLTENALDEKSASDVLRKRVLEARSSGTDILAEGGNYDDYLGWHRNLSEDTAPYFDEMSADLWRFVAANYRADAT